MGEMILKDFETFEEIPDGVLLIKEGTNLSYVTNKEETFVAREFIESVENDDVKTKYTIGYYDVINNKNRLTIKIVKDNNSGKVICLYNEDNIKVITLDKMLNIKGNSVAYFDIDDVKDLNAYKKPQTSEKRKYYF